MEESSNGKIDETQEVGPQEVIKKPELILKEEQCSRSHNSNLADAEAEEQDVRAEKLDETDVLSEETTVTRDGSTMDAKESEDANFQALRENPNEIPLILTDVMKNMLKLLIDAEPKRTDQLLSENVEAISLDFTGKETEEKPEPGLEENEEDSSSFAKVEKGSMENPEDSSKTSAASNAETTASNHPAISLRDRSGQPATATSWVSCCGLFEVLRRSNR